MKRHRRQYTLRSIPAELDKALRIKARAQGVSLNQAAIEALAIGIGLGLPKSAYSDLDVVVGSWVEDRKFDEALAAQDQVDADAWR